MPTNHMCVCDLRKLANFLLAYTPLTAHLQPIGFTESDTRLLLLLDNAVITNTLTGQMQDCVNAALCWPLLVITCTCKTCYTL